MGKERLERTIYSPLSLLGQCASLRVEKETDVRSLGDAPTASGGFGVEG